MGTHPIFESDFDCLTELEMSLSDSSLPKLQTSLDPSDPRRKVIDSLSLPKNEMLIQDSKIKLQKCFLCDLEFDIGSTQREIFLAHVITNHKMVIGDVDLISDLTSYVAYWRK